MRDPQGVAVIQRLFETAKSGDGFLRYIWNKPSTGKPADKLSYVVELKRWGWMYGTGIYLDDVAAGTQKIKAQTTANITATLLGLAVVAVIATLAVFAGGLALNISEQRIADQQLKQLTQPRLLAGGGAGTCLARTARRTQPAAGLDQVPLRTGAGAPAVRTPMPPRPRKPSTPASPASRKRSARSAASRTTCAPRCSTTLGLPAALEQLAEDFGHRTGIAVSAAIGPLPALATGSATTSLFRVAQEALTNVERHAHARQVELTLDCEDDNLRLAIRDDGLGLAATGPLNKGIGLRNMRERVEHHGGSLRWNRATRSVVRC